MILSKKSKESKAGKEITLDPFEKIQRIQRIIVSRTIAARSSRLAPASRMVAEARILWILWIFPKGSKTFPSQSLDSLDLPDGIDTFSVIVWNLWICLMTPRHVPYTPSFC